MKSDSCRTTVKLVFKMEEQKKDFYKNLKGGKCNIYRKLFGSLCKNCAVSGNNCDQYKLDFFIKLLIFWKNRAMIRMKNMPR